MRTRICRNKDMIFTFIPVKIAKTLKEKGIWVGDEVEWILEGGGEEVIARVVFRKHRTGKGE